MVHIWWLHGCLQIPEVLQTFGAQHHPSKNHRFTESWKHLKLGGWVQPCFEKIWVKLDQNHFLQVLGVKIQQKKFETTTKSYNCFWRDFHSQVLISCVFFHQNGHLGCIPGSQVRTGKWKPSRSCDNLGVGWVGNFCSVGLLLRSSLNQW